MQSTNNFRVPEPGEGILLGGETSKNWLTVIVDNLSPLNYKFFCASPEVKEFIEKTAKGNVQVDLINLPVDKIGIRDAFESNNIRAVFNLCAARAKVRYDRSGPALEYNPEHQNNGHTRLTSYSRTFWIRTTSCEGMQWTLAFR